MEVVRGAGMVFVLVILFLGGKNRKVVAHPPPHFFSFSFSDFSIPILLFFFFPGTIATLSRGPCFWGGKRKRNELKKNDVCWVFDIQVFLPSSGTPPTPHFPPPFLFLPSYCSPSLTISPKYIFFPFATKLWSRYAPALFGNGDGRK